MFLVLTSEGDDICSYYVPLFWESTEMWPNYYGDIIAYKDYDVVHGDSGLKGKVKMGISQDSPFINENWFLILDLILGLFPVSN